MKKLLFIMVITILIFSSLAADSRSDNIDLFLVVDKSLSMEEEIFAVREYISDFLISSFLIPGDNLLVINFYGEAETAVKITLDNGANKQHVLDTVDSILADGRYTDIGNALDKLKREVELLRETGRKRYLLLITDGIQEAPPDSPYWSENGTFNHSFLENTRTIRREGWKIQIIGLGSATAARQIAEELSGAYSEIDLPSGTETAVSSSSTSEMDGTGEEMSDTLTADALGEAAAGLLGNIEVIDGPHFALKDESGSGILSLEIQSDGYSEPQNVSLEGIYFSGRGYEKWDLLTDSRELSSVVSFLDFSIPPGEKLSFRIPLTFPPVSEGETLVGEVYFVFSGNRSITPASFKIEEEVEAEFPLIPVLTGAGFVLLFLIIFLIIRSRGNGAKEAFEKAIIDLECSIRGKRDVSKNLLLGKNERIYILQQGFGLDFLKSRKSEIENALAYVSFHENKLTMETLKPDILKTKGFFSGNILGKELEFLLSGKDNISVKFYERSKNGE